jgi:hypothetical protein
MARVAAKFTQADVERVLRASKRTGVPVQMVVVAGRMVISSVDAPANEGAELEDELTAWRKKHGEG